MGEELQKEDKTDISRNVEEILLGIFLLFGSVVTTFYYFMVKPHFFSRIVVDNDPLSGAFPKKYSRPITYYFISLVLVTGGFILIFKITPDSKINQENNPIILLFTDALKEGNLIKLIIASSPLILSVGLYSFSLYWVNRKKYPRIKFRNSLFLSSYFAGTFLLIYVLFIPVFPLTSEANASAPAVSQISPFSPWVGAIIGVIAWSCFFRALYSYLVLLKHLAQSNRIATIKVFLRGLFFFLLVYYMILAWLTPLAYKLIETIDK